MDIPVYGFVIHEDGDSNGAHRHEMYLMTSDGRVLHVHEFSGFTSHDVGHHHQYAGTTNPAPNTPNHAHDYETYISFDDGHRHLIRGRTGPAIPLSTGGHIHFFEGITTVNGAIPHYHRYSGRTSGAIG